MLPAHHGTLDLRARPDGGLRVTLTLPDGGLRVTLTLPRTDGRATVKAPDTETDVAR
ncbi:hypothetical protein ACQPZG_00445 (plasmid) [Streptomyces sp. CA-294286]|uniref:hypothetical protein n=1 Tax=Streptomyces sp. CA-294286 TaxID=3240070 RepID=UPI003D8E400B